MGFRLGIAGLLLIMSGLAQANERFVLRCVDRDGKVTFTNTSRCPAGSQERVAATFKNPDPIPREQSHHRGSEATGSWQAQERQRSYTTGTGGSLSSYRTNSEPDWMAPCRAARAQDAAARKRNRNLSYDEIRRLNGLIYAACQGRVPPNR